MKTNIVFWLAAMLLAATSVCAKDAVVTGKVIDAADKSPVAFANIRVLKQDSTFISGTTSDLDGHFEIPGLPHENCILSVTYIGYDPEFVPLNQAEPSGIIEILLKQSSIALSEVTIQAKSIIVKDDRKVILPTEEQVKMSVDGTDVIRKMQLPRIMVDPLSGEITMAGNGVVQLRVNGVEVTNAEIASIPPADILRIEYHDDPGARYGNADVVIDYITQRRQSGGNVSASLYNGKGGKRYSADDKISFKQSYGKSEFAANAMFIQRRGDWTREYDEYLYFPNTEIHRLEVGEPTRFDKKVFSTNLNYSLTEKDKYFLNVQFKYMRNQFPNGFEDRRTTLYTSGSDIGLNIYDHTTEKANLPALDIYYQQNLKNNQLLIFNLVGTYIGTDSKRIYQEKAGNEFETNLLSDIHGKKYSVIGEAIYEKKLSTGKITGGVKHLQSSTDNEYRGSTVADISMRQAESYVYAEYQGRAGQLGYMANITGVRLYYSQSGNYTEKYAVQPSARLTFEPNDDLYFRYRINLRTNAPSLAAMNNIEQSIDAFQVRRGNPDLDAFRTLSQNFTTGYNKNMWGVDLMVSYDHEYNPIMESVFYENEKFVRTYENQQSFSNLGMEATFKIKPWKNHLSLSVTPRIDRFISKGNNYLHTYTMRELRVNLDFSYDNWIANFTTITPPRIMYGEQLTKSDQMYTIMAGYKRANWSIMAGVLNPFSSTYKTDNRNWSALNPVVSEIHTNNNRSILVKLNVKLNYGKQSKGNVKRVNNMDTDSGILQGVKN